MNIEEFRDYCLSLPDVTEKMPFTHLKQPASRDVLCFYVNKKWFCFVNIVMGEYCCLKVPADQTLELQAQYQAVRPAWHMNKKHWVDVYFNQDMTDEQIKAMVWQSYCLIAK